MSWRPTRDPQEAPVPEPVEPEVESILTPRDRDLGGFVVRRLLPASRQPGVEIRVLVGDAFGRRSPVKTFSRLAYADVAMEAGSSIELPDDGGDRGAYVVDGEVTCGAERCPRWHMLLFRSGRRAHLRA